MPRERERTPFRLQTTRRPSRRQWRRVKKADKGVTAAKEELGRASRTTKAAARREVSRAQSALAKAKAELKRAKKAAARWKVNDNVGVRPHKGQNDPHESAGFDKVKLSIRLQNAINSLQEVGGHCGPGHLYQNRKGPMTEAGYTRADAGRVNYTRIKPSTPLSVTLFLRSVAQAIEATNANYVDLALGADDELDETETDSDDETETETDSDDETETETQDDVPAAAAAAAAAVTPTAAAAPPVPRKREWCGGRSATRVTDPYFAVHYARTAELQPRWGELPPSVSGGRDATGSVVSVSSSVAYFSDSGSERESERSEPSVIESASESTSGHGSELRLTGGSGSESDVGGWSEGDSLVASGSSDSKSESVGVSGRESGSDNGAGVGDGGSDNGAGVGVGEGESNGPRRSQRLQIMENKRNQKKQSAMESASSTRSVRSVRSASGKGAVEESAPVASKRSGGKKKQPSASGEGDGGSGDGGSGGGGSGCEEGPEESADTETPTTTTTTAVPSGGGGGGGGGGGEGCGTECGGGGQSRSCAKGRLMATSINVAKVHAKPIALARRELREAEARLHEANEREASTTVLTRLKGGVRRAMMSVRKAEADAAAAVRIASFVDRAINHSIASQLRDRQPADIARDLLLHLFGTCAPTEPVFIFYGAAKIDESSFTPQYHLHKRVRAALAAIKNVHVIHTDEAYTSAACSYCAFGHTTEVCFGYRDTENGHQPNVIMRAFQKRYNNNYRLKQCAHCKTIAHRDRSAARMILLVGLYETLFEGRPITLTHRSKLKKNTTPDPDPDPGVDPESDPEPLPSES